MDQAERIRQIEALREELHRRMGGRYDPKRMAELVEISQELDRLVVEYTRLHLQPGERSRKKS